MSCTPFTSLHQTCDRPPCRFFLPEILITAYTPSPSPSHGGSTTSEKQRIAYRFVSYHQTGYNTSDSLGILGLLCAEGEKKSLHRVIRLAKLETRVLVRNPFFRTRGCGRGDQENTEREEDRVAFHIQQARGTTTYTSRSSLDQLAKTPT